MLKNTKIIKKIIRVLTVFAIGLFLATGIVGQNGTSYRLISSGACQGTAEQCASQGAGLTKGTGANVSIGGVIKEVVNILSIVVGIAAVIMMVIGGLRFVISGGDTSNVNNARNTIIYALVGLVVAALAQVLVHFVLANVA